MKGPRLKGPVLAATEEELERLIKITDAAPADVVTWLAAWADGERSLIPDHPQGDGDYLPAVPDRVAGYFESYLRLYFPRRAAP